MRSALIWPLVLAYPALIIAGIILCLSQIPECKEQHKKEKQADAQAYAAEIGAAISKKRSSNASTKKKGDPTPPDQCGWCGILTKTSEDPVALFTLVLSVFVWLQFVWMIRQERVTQDSVSAAMLQAHAAVATQLPIIAFSDQKLVGYDAVDQANLDPVPPGVLGMGIYRALIHINNVGKSNAYLLRLSIRHQIAKELPPEPHYGHMAVTNEVIGEGKPLWVHYPREVIGIGEAERLRMEKGEHLWVYGFIAYGDFMSEITTIGFSYRWEIVPEEGIRPRGLIPDGPPSYRYQERTKKQSWRKK